MRTSLPVKWSLTLGSLVTLAGCQSAPLIESGSGETPENVPDEAAETTEMADQPAQSSAPTADYRDGTYAATGGYQSPNGPETVEVSITLTGGVISDVEVTPQATNSTSTRYQGDFAGGIAKDVVGKSIDEAEVSRVAGSSLTSGGFAEALQSIRQDAKAS